MPETSNPRPNVMISSTARDLPAHRKEAMDACLRQGMFPYMMEHLPAKDADARQVSIELVDQADIYLGLFAHRYGHVPDGSDVSVTEMEYERAVERKIPRLIFLMRDDYAVLPADVEKGAGAVKLEALKERLKKERVVAFFGSPEDLRGHVIDTLSRYRQPDLATFHYVSDIPAPPEPFLAHPYTLLQTGRLVGRQPELNLLTDWVARPDSQIFRARILNVVAVGGLGKSALTWHWFQTIAPQEMKPLAGRMWWSFYESDATVENFVTRALAYVSRRPLAEVRRIPAPDREARLLNALDREPHLVVLDGLERILIAYARMDAAHLSDDDYDKQTANFVADAAGLPASAAQSFTGEHRLRKTADPRAGSFLRKLAQSRASRILVSTRLYPADLQTRTDEPLPGCLALFLRGLADDDALELWRASGVSGARATLLRRRRASCWVMYGTQQSAGRIGSFTPTRATCWCRSSVTRAMSRLRSRRRRRLTDWRGATGRRLRITGGWRGRGVTCGSWGQKSRRCRRSMRRSSSRCRRSRSTRRTSSGRGEEGMRDE